MPSLKNLDAFAGLFRSVGGEERILAERGETPDEMELPDKEPEPLPADDNLAALMGEAPQRDVPAEKSSPQPALGADAAGNSGADPLSGLEDLDASGMDPLSALGALDTTEMDPLSGLDGLGDSGLEPQADDVGAGVIPDFDFGNFARPTDEDLSPRSIDDALPPDSNEMPIDSTDTNDANDTVDVNDAVEANDAIDGLTDSNGPAIEETSDDNKDAEPAAVSPTDGFNPDNFDNLFEGSALDTDVDY